MLAETANGLYKTEMIHRQGPWRSLKDVEWATLKWVDWFNNRRLLSTIGNIPPAEAEIRFYKELETIKLAAQDANENASGKSGTVHSSMTELTFHGINPSRK